LNIITPPSSLHLSQLTGWCLVVVGDRKTPTPYNVPTAHENFVYLSAEKQESMAAEFPLSGALPWNHFGRKNFGFLYAILHGAKVKLHWNTRFVIPGIRAEGVLKEEFTFIHSWID
jgi:hypothetical protein